MKKNECYCHVCCDFRLFEKKDIKVRREIAVMWDDLEVPHDHYYYVCPVCGEELYNAELNDKSMADLAENRKIVIELS